MTEGEAHMGKRKKNRNRQNETEKAPDSIRLTAKGLGDMAGKIITYRWALKHIATGKVVYVYDPSEKFALECACRHFQTTEPLDVTIEKAGHVEWKIVDEGTKNERASQHLVWYPGHDQIELVDLQFEKKQKKEKKS